MSKRSQNIIREGLSAKIYLLAFNGPISGYEIAQRIQNLESGKTPQTAKIYGWTNKMINENMLKKTEDGYMANAKVMLPHIKDFLANKEIQISDIEEHIILTYIDSENFRMYVEESFFYEKNFFEGAIDSVRHISEILGDLALEEHVMRGDDEEELKDPECFRRISDFTTKKEFDRYWAENIIPQIDYEDSHTKKFFENRRLEEDFFNKHGSFIEGGWYEDLEKNRIIARVGKKIKHWRGDPDYVFFLPSSLVKKLCRLSSTYDLFQRASSNSLLEPWLKKEKRRNIDRAHETISRLLTEHNSKMMKTKNLDKDEQKDT
jgi:hypothetical protein